MPAFDTSTPRIKLKVAGLEITAPAPYTAGYVLTEGDAKFLNRAVAGTVGNPIPAAIKDAKEAAIKEGKPEPVVTVESLQPHYDARYAAYELGVSNRGGGSSAEPTDPVSVFTRQLAEKALNEKLKEKKRNIRDVKSTKMRDANGNETEVSVYIHLRDQLIASDPSFRSRAEAMVAAMGQTQSAPVELDMDLLDGVVGNETTAG